MKRLDVDVSLWGQLNEHVGNFCFYHFLNHSVCLLQYYYSADQKPSPECMSEEKKKIGPLSGLPRNSVDKIQG